MEARAAPPVLLGLRRLHRVPLQVLRLHAVLVLLQRLALLLGILQLVVPALRLMRRHHLVQLLLLHLGPAASQAPLLLLRLLLRVLQGCVG